MDDSAYVFVVNSVGGVSIWERLTPSEQAKHMFEYSMKKMQNETDFRLKQMHDENKLRYDKEMKYQDVALKIRYDKEMESFRETLKYDYGMKLEAYHLSLRKEHSEYTNKKVKKSSLWHNVVTTSGLISSFAIAGFSGYSAVKQD